jgi:hypothetical protein
MPLIDILIQEVICSWMEVLKVLQNKEKAVADNTKFAIKCSRIQTKPYHTNELDFISNL